MNLNELIPLIYIIGCSFAFLIVCIGISYLRTTSYHRYDSLDFIDDEEDAK